jgi:arylsulfatase A-like enzyme
VLVPVLLAANTLASVPAPPRPGGDRPDIVLILADDLGLGEIGPFGQREIKTPNLDRLSAEGVRLTQFYAGSCVCAPSRCTLMTGLHSGHGPVRDNDVGALRSVDVTLADVLKQAGYATGFFGKWGLSKESRPESWPTRQGFDTFFGYRDQTHAHNPWPEFLMSGEGRVALPNKVPGAGPEGEGIASERKAYAPDRILDEALAFMSAHRASPFFLCFAPTFPHINNEAASRPDGGFEVPGPGEYAGKPWPLPKKSYAAAVSYLDAQAGRLLARLSELGLDGKTLVIFTSDNGPTAMKSANDGTTDVIGLWFAGKSPLAGFKHDLREGGIRVPMIVRRPLSGPKGSPPRGLRPGTADATPAYFPDQLPTFADYAGLAAPDLPSRARTDGTSLRGLLEEGKPLPPDRALYWGYPDRDQHAVREGRWKAWWIDGQVALHDLEADPREQRDVAPANLGVVSRLDRIRREQMRRERD